MAMRCAPPVYSPVAARALASGWGAAVGWGNGTALERLSEELRSRFGAAVALLVDSGTSALAIALTAALRDRPGAPVALPAYCCYDVATAAAAADVPVLLYDIDPTTLGPDWPSLEHALALGAGAVVVAHLLGLAVDTDRALDRCAAADAVLIEDAAQGVGGRMRDRPLGALGPLSVLSFGRGKGWTGGTGGALLARGAGVSLLEAARGLAPAAGAWRALLGATAQWLLAWPPVYGLPATLPFLRLGQTIYRRPHPPRALATGPAALALASLAASDAEAQIRRARARRIAAGALAAGLAVVPPLAESAAGYLRFPLLLGAEPPDGRARAVGIARAYPLALVDLPQLGPRCLNRDGAFPGARRLAAELYTAPTHSRLSETDVDALLSWIETRGRNGRVA